MRGARLPFGAVAQEKKGCAVFGGSQAEAAAGGKIECFGVGPDIGDNAGYGPAGDRFFGNP